MASTGSTFEQVLARKMQDPEFRQEYEALSPRFDLSDALIRLRLDAGLSQEQLAQRMGVKCGYIARMESRPANLTLRTLARIAGALGADMEIRMIPDAERPVALIRVPARRLVKAGLLDRLA